MIKKLTKKQKARFPEFIKKWTDIGLSCEPVDLPRFARGIEMVYAAIGLKHPGKVIVCDSPLSAALTAKSRKDGISVRSKVWGSVYNRGRSNVSGSISNSVRNSVWNSVENSVENSVWNSVRDSVRASARKSVRDSVSNSVKNIVWNSVRNSFVNSRVNNSFYETNYGSHEVGGLSFYSFMREVLGLKEETEPLVGQMEMAQSAGWYALYDNCVIVQHRHCEIHRNSEGRLHNEKGMAVKYRDGWGVWAIGGVTVDEQIVMKPETQTVEQIRLESDQEVKRVRIERFGWDRYLTGIDAREVDSRHNAIENTYEVLVKTPDGMTVLLPTCKTGRLFSLEVPGEIETCEQAQLWLHSGSKIDKLIGRTRVIGRT